MGELRASDDLSEARFFEVEELGSVPLTPLVTRVLQRAGYLDKQGRPMGTGNADPDGQRILALDCRAPVAGARRHVRPREMARSHPAEHTCNSVQQIALLL